MIRCAEGHFWDPAKHSACPWCGVAAQAAVEESDASPKTRPVRAIDAAPAAARIQEHGVTKALHREPTGVSPVVGWLVCIEGPDKGRDFRLHAEKNFIGRSHAMDVAITGDEAISRDKHASVTFDPKKKAFWVAPGDSSGLVYLNDELVNTPVQMNGDDVLELGSTKVVLVPLHTSKAQW